MHNLDNVYVKTVGSTTTEFADGRSHPHKTNAKWDLEYNNDGINQGGVQGTIETDQDGRKERYKLEMDNDDLARVFGMPSSKGNMLSRLQTDFEMPRRRVQQELGHIPIQIFNDEPEMLFREPYQEASDDYPSFNDDMMLFAPMEQSFFEHRAPTIMRIAPMRRTHGRKHLLRTNPSRKRRIHINYSSGPARVRRHHTVKRRRTPYKKSSRKSSRTSRKSNLPLTEIND